MGVTGKLFDVLLPGLAFAALFIWYTRRKNALSPSGATAAAFTGLWVLWFAGPAWLLPLFFFFISSTLLGRFSKKKPGAADRKHGQPRDYRQVLCNGGIYAALATLAPGPSGEIALTLMAVSLAISTADTWSSEIGQAFGSRTLDILRWKSVPSGLSGGVSVAGTLGGLAGGVCQGVLCNFLIIKSLDPKPILLIATAGFLGMLLDSLLGAGLQARYRDTVTGNLSDQSSENSVLHSGISWMDNDGVNICSNALLTFAAFWLMQ